MTYIVVYIFTEAVSFPFFIELTACSIFSCKLFCLGILIRLFNNLFR